MKMRRGMTSCCVALLLALTSVFGVQRKLNSISDVHLPTDIIVLLHWFANQLNIDNCNIIQLNFDCGDYGSHHYGNFEGLLERPRRRHKYYTVGNHKGASFPSYVVHPWTGHANENTARIVFSINTENGGRVDKVFITRHLQGTKEYDPEHTYEVTTSLLQEIRSLSIEEIKQFLIRHLRRLIDTLLPAFPNNNQHTNEPQPAKRTTTQSNREGNVTEDDSPFRCSRNASDSNLQGFHFPDQHSTISQSTARETDQSNYEANVIEDNSPFRCSRNTSDSNLQGFHCLDQHSASPLSTGEATDQSNTENNLIIFMLVIFITIIVISTSLFHLIK